MKPVTNSMLQQMFDDSSFIRTMSNLNSRWMDEASYENVQDYKDAVSIHTRKHLGISVQEMTSKPFGFFIKTKCVFPLKAGGEIIRPGKIIIEINKNKIIYRIELI